MPENSSLLSCYKCNKEISFTKDHKIGRHDECDHCGASLRCCTMCHFYDPKSYNECKEPMAERNIEKERANFCDHYMLRSTNGDQTSKDELLSAADALFKFN